MLTSIFGFLLVIAIIVFIHELGHYIAARLCGVRVLEFSIGFGKSLFQIKDSHNTIWKICAFPLGGYVKMYGDQNIYSNHTLTSHALRLEKEAFAFQSPIKRALIAFAGPLANYLLAGIIITLLYYSFGKNIVSTEIGKVLENSPAVEAGIVKDDKILAIDNKEILSFDEIYHHVSLIPNTLIKLKILRNDEIININLKTGEREIKDQNGKILGKVGVIGVMSKEPVHIDLNLFSAISYALNDITAISKMTLISLKQIITGTRSTSEIRGTLTIANESGKNLESGLIDFVAFIAMISINIGFINLLPIPVLDGGHIMYCFYEIIARRKPSANLMNLMNKFGIILIIFIFVISTSNDINALLF